VEQTQNVFRECSEEFERRIYPDGGVSIMCKLHATLASQCVSCHNCLGCNFAEETRSIRNHLSQYDSFDDGFDAFRFYLLRLYLLVERMDVILNLIQLPNEYRYKHFTVLNDVRKWANFIKHPGPFLLVHHPTYLFEDDTPVDVCYRVVIDQEFVRQYYSSDKETEIKKKLWQLLANSAEVAVLLPNPIKLTQRFCEAIERFVSMIASNTVHQDILAQRTTYEEYFTRPDPCAHLQPGMVG
jgi:hypothetical protein